MPSYRSPGVYVEEVPPMSRPIAGVSTSVPGFVGVLDDSIVLPYRDPADREIKWSSHTLEAQALTPYRISSWANYVKQFGDLIGDKAHADGSATEPKDTEVAARCHLAHAVFGFFNNGGTSCYVVRVLPDADGKTPTADITKALTALSAIEEISMVAAPGLSAKAEVDTLIDYATNNQQFAILDTDKDAKLASLEVKASPYSALYYPWLRVFDPAQALLDKDGDGTILVPPSGHVAGVYARSDSARGVFKAPANEALLGVVSVDTNVTRDEQGAANDKGINIIRQLNGALRIWGARTTGGALNGEYCYVSSRRYFNYLRQSIDNGTQFVVFEPHTPALWQRVVRTLSDFLTNEWRSGALFGETAKQAFFIKCDAEINPPESRDQGRLIVEIGVALVKPAEFAIFRIQQS
jgi:uncharacterized protein